MRWQIVLAAIVMIGVLAGIALWRNPSIVDSLFNRTPPDPLGGIIPVYDVRDYGAKGDGVREDTEAIMNAVRAAQANGGGTVYFGKGTYLVRTIHVPENISLLGAGSTLSTLVRKNDLDEAMLRLLGNQTVQSLGIKANLGILPYGDDITILNARFECSVQGIQNAVTVRRLSVINSLFENTGYGILSNFNPSYDVKIVNCRFVNIKSDGIEINAASEGWLIENCIFDTNASGSRWSGFGVGAAMSAKDITIRNSSFVGQIGQGVHVEDHAEVTIINSSFKNNGAAGYPGDPEADIAVLSNAKVTVVNCNFFASDDGYSSLAIYNTDLPVGGTVTVSHSRFYNKTVNRQVLTENCQFITL